MNMYIMIDVILTITYDFFIIVISVIIDFLIVVINTAVAMLLWVGPQQCCA